MRQLRRATGAPRRRQPGCLEPVQPAHLRADGRRRAQTSANRWP